MSLNFRQQTADRFTVRRMAQSGSDHKDFLYYLLKQQESGSINENEVIVNGALFM